MGAMDYQQHPLSAAFPAMSGAEVDALAADIQAHGQREPGLLFEGMVLDGWHRYLACIRGGVAFEAEPYRGKDPAALVLSRNLHRRHLTGSQRAQAVVAVSTWRPYGDQKSRSAPGADRTDAEMAKTAEVGERTIRQAKVVEERGAPEVKEAVRTGALSVKEAEPIARKPQKDQPAAVKKATSAERVEKPKAKPDTDKLHARIAELEAELAEMNERLPDLIHAAESAKAFESNAEFIEMQILRGELRDAKRAEATAKRERNEMLKQVTYWKRRAEKCEGKK